jgi:hypothetical protein
MSRGETKTLISGINTRDIGCGSVGIDYLGKLAGNYTVVYGRNVTQDFYCSTIRPAVDHSLVRLNTICRSGFVCIV